jgi:signal transduction histidine kinase/ligand-binding sensor domain-containing protein/DNA-binding response OmpR family regulator
MSKKNKYLLKYIPVSLLLPLLFCSVVVAQPEQLKFTAITMADGLSSNTVTDIIRDRKGYLWYATDDGLNKFDGKDFTVFRNEKQNNASLKSNDISTLFEDSKGRIWIGTVIGSLHLYDANKNSFVRINTNQTITSICEGYAGELWIGTSTGLVIIDPITLKTRSLPAVDPIPKQIMDKYVRRIYKDRLDRMWIGTETGLFCYYPQKKLITVVAHRPVDSPGHGRDFIEAIQQDSLGNIWVGTHEGLNMLSPEGKFVRQFTYSPNLNSISNNWIYDIAVESKNKLWVCTDGGLNILDIKTGQITTYEPNPRTPFSLTNKSIRNIFIDPTGIYWLGTYKGGVNKYDKNLTMFSLKRSNPYDQFGLSAPFVTSFAENVNGDIFVGTDGGGLNLYHPKTDLFSRYRMQPKIKTASAGRVILSLLLTSPKDLWIGTFQDGLFLLNPITGQYEQFVSSTDTSSISNNEIFCLKNDNKGNIWIGTNGGGVNIFNPSTKTFTRLFDRNTALPKRIIPLNGYIRDIVEDAQGMMWIASHGTGIAVYNTLTRQSTLLNAVTSNLPSNNVLTIFEDSRKDIWVGTSGEGLALFNKKTKKFIHFGIQHGLSSGVVNKIIEDRQGKIWITTNDGISSFDPRTKKFINYNRQNGLQNNSFSLGAGLRSSKDILYFGGVSGFNFLDVSTIKNNHNLIPVVFKDLRVGNKTITAIDSNIIKGDISVAKSIQLEYKQNFSIAYAGLNYTNPKQTIYRYRLLGLDKEWNQVGYLTTANYTNLNPGSYQFQVQASSNNLDWSPEMATIHIVIKPPFYLTLYAYAFYILVPIGIVLWIRRRGINKLKRKFRLEQQQREIERAQELDKIKIKFLTNLSHEFRTPISLILAPLENLSSVSTGSESHAQIRTIKRNAKRLLNLVDQILDFKNLHQQETKLNLQRGEIVSFIREVCESFNELSLRKGIGFSSECTVHQLYFDFDANKIERILFNLLSNAFKFTPKGGKVVLTLTTTTENNKHWFNIFVSDNGIGVALNNQDKIFERFFQDENTGSSLNLLNQGSGIGLSIVKEFVQMHKGILKIDSEPEKGSTFIVSLPYEVENIVFPETMIHATPKFSENDKPSTAQNTWIGDAYKQDTSTVLIVEDNDEFRHFLQENLQRHYKILSASNGKEGWQKSLAQHPDLIVSDIAMPEMDGIEMSQKIKSDKRTNHIPIILLTASTGEEQQLKGLSSGANDYLTKPFNFDILYVKINNLLLMNRLLKNMYLRQFHISGPDTTIQSGDEKLIQDILTYIEDNLNSTQLSVEKLSKHVGMSRSTLYSKVLEISGQTPIEFIRSIKLEKAAILLEKSDLNVSQISYTAGFATPNYFTKSFKAKFNMLPSEYKNAKRKLQSQLPEE